MAVSREDVQSRFLLVIGYVSATAFFIWTRWPLLFDGFWRDDAVTIAIARSGSAADFLAKLGFLDSQPPLYPASVAIWGRVFGWSETALKIDAFCWGAAAVIALVVLGWELFGPWGGLTVLVLASNHPLLLSLSGELRPYSASIALLAFAFFVLFSSKKRPAVFRFLCLAPILILLVYSQYTATMAGALLGTFALVATVRGKKTESWRPVLAACALAGIAFLPWVPTAVRHLRIGIPWEPARTLAEKMEALPSGAVAVFPWMFSPAGLAGQLGFAILLLALVIGWDRVREQIVSRRSACVLLAACAVLVFAAMSLLAEPQRYLRISAALGCVLGAGILTQVPGALRRGTLAYAARLGSVLVIAGAFAVSHRDLEEMSVRRVAGTPKSGARAFCQQFSPKAQDLLLAVPDFGATTLRYYCGTGVRMHGYPQWENPEIPNWEGYRARWTNSSVPETIARMELVVDSGEVDRVLLVRQRVPRFFRAIPFARSQVDQLRENLAVRYAQTGSRTYDGQLETIEVTEYRPRRDSRTRSQVAGDR